MAQSGRFSLALRILLTLAREPDRRQTSAELAEALSTGPVMVRRLFRTLHQAGFISQHRGPSGGARLKHSAKSIGLGDLYLAIEPQWLQLGDPALDPVLLKTRKQALATMNETTLAQVLRKQKTHDAAHGETRAGA